MKPATMLPLLLSSSLACLAAADLAKGTGAKADETGTGTDETGDGDGDEGPIEWPAPTPVLVDTLVTMPGHAFHVLDSVPLCEAVWTGEYFFVATAHCHPGTEGRGMWVFDDSGGLVQERHVCLDSLADGQDSDLLYLELHQWSVGCRQHVLGPGTILREAGRATAGHGYPPMVYGVFDATTVERIARPYALITDPNQAPNEPQEYGLDSSPRIINSVVIDDLMLAIDTGAPERQGVIYSLPELEQLALFPAPKLNPYQRLGDYVMIFEEETVTFGLYALTATEIERIAQLEFAVPIQRIYPRADREGRVLSGEGHMLSIHRLAGEALEWVETRDRTGLVPANLIPTVYIDGNLEFYAWHLFHDGVEVPLPSLPSYVDHTDTEVEQGDSDVRSFALSKDGKLVVVTTATALLYDLYPSD